MAVDPEQADAYFQQARRERQSAVGAHAMAPPDAAFSTRLSALAQAAGERAASCEQELDSIPTARVRAFLETELARDPDLTRAEIAHRLDMRQADLDRQLGYTASKGGEPQQRVGIPAASRLTLALGRDPRELEGC